MNAPAERALFEWWPVRDAPKARWFWGSQAVLALLWVGPGAAQWSASGWGFGRVFVIIGSAYLPFIALAAHRPRLAVYADRLAWRSFARSSCARWDVVSRVSVGRTGDVSLRPLQLVDSAGDVIKVSMDAVGWLFESAADRDRLLTALRAAAQGHIFAVEG